MNDTVLHMTTYDFVSGQTDRALLDGVGSVEFIRTIESRVPYADLAPRDFTLRFVKDWREGVHAWFVSDRGGLLVSTTAESTTVNLTLITSTHALAGRVFGEIKHAAGNPGPTVKHLRVWSSCDGAFYGDRQPMTIRTWPDIAANCCVRTRRSLDQLMQDGPPKGSARLILWNGPPGTGKTTAALALMDAWYPWSVPHVISDPEQLFRDPAYLRRLMSFKVYERQQVEMPGEDRPNWNLLVCEDADEFLRRDTRAHTSPDLARLLNATDGVLAQQSRCVFLLTTNEEVSRIHPAITRYGRCLSQVQFQRFPAEQASGWLGGAPVSTEPTLAELFAMREGVTAEPDGYAFGAYL